MKVSDLPGSVRAALKAVEYGRKDIEVLARETFDPSSAGGDGYRGFVAACRMDDSDIYELSWGSWGGENMFKRTIEGLESETIPPHLAFLKGQIGGGRPTYAKLYVSPRAMNPALLAAPAEVTAKEAKILGIFHSLKSGPYRKEALQNLGATLVEIRSLVDRGFLKENKAGAIALTTDGTNARDTRGIY